MSLITMGLGVVSSGSTMDLDFTKKVIKTRFDTIVRKQEFDVRTQRIKFATQVRTGFFALAKTNVEFAVNTHRIEFSLRD